MLIEHTLFYNYTVKFTEFMKLFGLKDKKINNR